MKKLLLSTIVYSLLLTGCGSFLQEDVNDPENQKESEQIQIPDSVTIRLPKSELILTGESVGSTINFNWIYDTTNHSFSDTIQNATIWFTQLGNVAVSERSDISNMGKYTKTAEVYTWDYTTYKQYDRYYYGESVEPVHYKRYNEYFFRTFTVHINQTIDEITGERTEGLSDSATFYSYTYDNNGIVNSRTVSNNYNDDTETELVTVETEGIYTRYTPAVLPDGISTVAAIVTPGTIPQEIRGTYTGVYSDTAGNSRDVFTLWNIGSDGHYEGYIWDENGENSYHSMRTFSTLKVASADLGTPIPFEWE